MISLRLTWLMALGCAVPVLGALIEPPARADRAMFDISAVPDDQPFRLSSDCETCHSNAPSATAMRDSAGRGVSPFDLWRGTMMANSARDPYWRAGLSAEIAATPSRRSELEEKCTRCHSPMASSAAGQSDNERHWSPDKAADLGPLSAFALDGVSCTVCHSILPDALGTTDSFTGGYWIDDQDRQFGPHAVTFTGPMVAFTGKIPTQSDHLAENSGLCGSCHTLFTHTLRQDGTTSGPLYAEQTPYLEWRNSSYQDEVAPFGARAADCQDCHVPTDSVDGVPIQTKIARSPAGYDYGAIPVRQPFGRHLLVGGNTLIPQILRDNPIALNVAAPAAAFDATIAATRDQLRNRTADLTIASATRNSNELDVVARIENLCGHKFPSGYPSRRTWLRVTVTDASSRVIWRSGNWDQQGRILTSNGQPLPSEAAGGPIVAHKDVVTNQDDPQIWEIVMADATGATTFRLLRAASNRKDNRLLPHGYSASHPDAASTTPVGIGADPNFAAGVDEVRYRIPAPVSAGPYDVRVELYYQPISVRWAAELFQINTPEIAAFMGYWNNADRSPELVDLATVRVN